MKRFWSFVRREAVVVVSVFFFFLSSFFSFSFLTNFNCFLFFNTTGNISIPSILNAYPTQLTYILIVECSSRCFDYTAPRSDRRARHRASARRHWRANCRQRASRASACALRSARGNSMCVCLCNVLIAHVMRCGIVSVLRRVSRAAAVIAVSRRRPRAASLVDFLYWWWLIDLFSCFLLL